MDKAKALCSLNYSGLEGVFWEYSLSTQGQIKAAALETRRGEFWMSSNMALLQIARRQRTWAIHVATKHSVKEETLVSSVTRKGAPGVGENEGLLIM